MERRAARQWPVSLDAMSATRDRYGRPAFRRPALAPALLAGVALLGAVALIESPAFLVFRFIVAILALIILVFAYQAKHWWWLPVMLAIAVVWNPVFPFGFDGPWWVGAQYVAILVFVLAGVLIKAPVTAEERRR
jgi:hypothetical protein